MTPNLGDRTTEMMNALHAVNRHVPQVAAGLATGRLPVAKQHEFASLPIGLGELLHQHADDQGSGTISGGGYRPEATPSGPRHALRQPAVMPPATDDDPYRS